MRRNNFLKVGARTNNQKGFTLIELILYVGLVSVFITVAMHFSWDVVYSREKSYQTQIVQQSARIAMQRISYEVRRAHDIASLTDSQLILATQEGQTIIELVEDVIYISVNGADFFALTPNQVVASIIFTNFTGENNDTKHVAVRLTLVQSDSPWSNQQAAEVTMEESSELRGRFNDARSLLIDLTNTSLNLNNIEGISLQNISTDNLVIDKLYIEWSQAGEGANVTEIGFGGGGVNWTGSAPSGTTIDINDFTLIPDTSTSLDYISFDESLAGARVVIKFILSDGSSVKANLVLGTSSDPEPSPTPTPTPQDPTSTPTNTPTPTPISSIDSCASYCSSVGYSTGNCRRNANQCTSNGEVNESGGNSYCTAGNNNTCCCKL
jgi:type II secretory pathway pseudopilin PulG